MQQPSHWMHVMIVWMLSTIIWMLAAIVWILTTIIWMHTAIVSLNACNYRLDDCIDRLNALKWRIKTFSSIFNICVYIFSRAHVNVPPQDRTGGAYAVRTHCGGTAHSGGVFALGLFNVMEKLSIIKFIWFIIGRIQSIIGSINRWLEEFRDKNE